MTDYNWRFEDYRWTHCSVCGRHCIDTICTACIDWWWEILQRLGEPFRPL